MRRAILISMFMVLFACAVAFSGQNAGVAKGAIHVRAHNAKAGCTVSITDCSDIVLVEAGRDVDAFPVFYDLVEWGGCEYGVVWPTWSYSAAFTSCSDFVIGEVVNPGDGASHSWTGCFYGVMVPAYLWLYADGPGQICMSGHPQHGAALVMDCETLLDELVGWGCAGVYGGVSDPASGNACDDLPAPATTPATWGQIKSLFQ